jgi:hypothetical protein
VLNSAPICSTAPPTLGGRGANPCHKQFQVMVPHKFPTEPIRFVSGFSLGGCGGSAMYVQRGATRYSACRQLRGEWSQTYCGNRRAIYTFECPL